MNVKGMEVAALMAGAMFFGGALVRVSTPEPTPTPTVTVTAPAQVAEDDPDWNCLTMGNHSCSPEDWKPVEESVLSDGSALLDVLTEGDRQDWTGCLVRWGDTTKIVCPDGYVETS